jgi:AraC-like DNA-binding protein
MLGVSEVAREMLLTPPVFRRLCRARDQLATLDEPLPSIRQIARDVHISPFHFIRQFEAVFGLTPHQFRTAVRIECAKRLLVRGELSVTEVCLEVGFSSLGSFSTLFARRVGASPSSYRRTVVQVPEHVRAPGCLSLMSLLPATAFRNFGEDSGSGLVLRGPSTPSRRGAQ